MNKTSILLFFLIICYLIFTNFSNYLLKADEIALIKLQEQLSISQINKIVGFQEKWQWVSYAILPLLLFIKIWIIATILNIGCFFFGKDIGYKKLFNIVVRAEFIFLLVIILKTAWFYFFQTNYTLEDLQYFYPLSALNIVGYQGLDVWWIYPFQTLNLFEVAYWIILAYLLGKELKTTTEKGLKIVASSYGVSLLIWIVGVMFFTLNMS